MLRRPLGSRDRVLERDQPPGPHALLEHRVELAEAPHLERLLPGPHAVGLRAVAEHLGGQLAAPRPDPVLHVLAVEEQRPAGLVAAADGHVDVGVGRVVVVDRHPLEPRPEVALHRVRVRGGCAPPGRGPRPARERGSSSTSADPRPAASLRGVGRSPPRCPEASKPSPFSPSRCAPSRAR